MAAGIFPALVLGLHWRRMNATRCRRRDAGGSLIAAAYLLGVHLWPVEFFQISGALSDAAPQAAKRFADLEATLSTAADPGSQVAAR